MFKTFVGWWWVLGLYYSINLFMGKYADISHDGSMVLLYLVTWIPSIYPLYVSINIPAPWIRHGNGMRVSIWDDAISMGKECHFVPMEFSSFPQNRLSIQLGLFLFFLKFPQKFVVFLNILLNLSTWMWIAIRCRRRTGILQPGTCRWGSPGDKVVFKTPFTIAEESPL